MLVAGSGFGTLIRYQLGLWLNGLGHWAWFWGTLSANTLACLMLGLLVGLGYQPTSEPQPHQQLVWVLLATGFCGGLSTFSTLILEFTQPAALNKSVPQVQGMNLSYESTLYLVLTIVIGIIALAGGQRMGRLLF